MIEPELVLAPEVRLFACTRILSPFNAEGPWLAQAQSAAESEAEALIEFAGRACYRSWSNPSGRNNAEYIANIIEMAHFSVLEHATATFWITGISRSCSHELVRHRMLSFSQESQRYVSAEELRFVVPPAVIGDRMAEENFLSDLTVAMGRYGWMLDLLEHKYAGIEDRTERRKVIREAARSLLPNAAETRMVVTGNLRAWRHVLHMRGAAGAEREIRRLAVVLCELLKEAFPAVFADVRVDLLPDGTLGVSVGDSCNRSGV